MQSAVQTITRVGHPNTLVQPRNWVWKNATTLKSNSVSKLWMQRITIHDINIGWNMFWGYTVFFVVVVQLHRWQTYICTLNKRVYMWGSDVGYTVELSSWGLSWYMIPFLIHDTFLQESRVHFMNWIVQKCMYQSQYIIKQKQLHIQLKM